MKRALLSIGLVFLVPSSSVAQAPGVISVSGLTLTCKDCMLESAEPCRVSRKTGLMSCNDALAELLEESGSRGVPESPSPADLRRYLLGQGVPSRNARAALALLLSSETGRRALVQDAYTFVSRYSSELASLVSKTADAKEVWAALWKLPASEGITLDPKLRASIAAGLDELDESELFADLSVASPEQDLGELSVYLETLSSARPQLAASIRVAQEFLERCRKGIQGTGVGDACAIDDTAHLSAAARRFVERTKVQWLVADAVAKNLPANDILSRLRTVDIAHARTPSLHDVVSKLLDAALIGQPEMRTTLLSPENLSVLRVFSANDKSIANRLIRVFCKSAEDEIASGRLEAALKILQQSFAINDETLDFRKSLLESIFNSTLWEREPSLHEEYSALLKRRKDGEPWYQLSQKQLLGLFGLLSGAAFLWMLAAYAYRERRLAEERQQLESELLILAEREELKELREFFGLEPGQGEAELTKVYRRKAKETHPDANASEDKGFQELNERYQRARELLSRIRGESEEPAAVE